MLSLKLKELKQDLKVWNREVFGDLSIRKSALLNELASLDRLDEGDNLDEASKDRKLEVSRDLNNLIELEAEV